MLYFIGWSLSLLILKFYLGFKVTGRENVPKKGAFLFVSNHVSNIDPFVLGASVYRSLNYMARFDLFDHPMSSWIFRGFHAFPVRREAGDLGAIRAALGMLKSGRPLVVFPEGTRSEDNTLRRAMPGTGFLVARSGVPVVPAYIKGSFETLPKGTRALRRHAVRVYIGKPIHFDRNQLDTKDRRVYQDMSDRIMGEIAILKEKSS